MVCTTRKLDDVLYRVNQDGYILALDFFPLAVKSKAFVSLRILSVSS